MIAFLPPISNEQMALRRFLAGLYQVVSREGRILGGFYNDRITTNQCRNQFPGGDRHREIPGGDQSAHSHRLPNTHGELLGHLRRSRKPMQPPAFAGRIICAVNRLLHIAATFLQNLPHLARHIR